MEINITFPGNKKVNAEINGQIIPTDQPVTQGGDGTAPSPFMHFIASIGTCAGIYVLSFCRQRNIPTENITPTDRPVYSTHPARTPFLDPIALAINVPPDFPEKYHKAIIKVAEQCAVKKAIANPPKFAISTIVR